MFTTFLKILVFVAIVTGLTWGAVQLLDMRGGANISVAGYEITLNALQLVFAFVALVVAVRSRNTCCSTTAKAFSISRFHAMTCPPA